MSHTVIRAERVGKKYLLVHSGRNVRFRHLSLRETVTERIRYLFRRRVAGNSSKAEFWALRDISFEVGQGEVLGIIGRNGGAKSTLLKILSRITEETEGRVRLEVGTGFHPELTARENIYLNGAILGMTRAEIKRKFDEIVDFADVHKFLEMPVKRFSSGMYVRLAFAVAANLEPEILLVDEVLAVGDAEFQKKCMGKMNEVSRSVGRTILFVSHQMNAVERLCSRALLIDRGRLRMDSKDVRSVIHTYLSSAEDAAPSNPGEWQNAGDEFDNSWFQPQRFFLADAKGAPLRMPARSDAEIWVHLIADFKALDPGLVIGYHFCAEGGEGGEGGELLYRSCQTDGKPEEWPRIRLGRTVLRAKIPSRLLNEGVYRLTLIAALHNREWIFDPNRASPTVFLGLQGSLSESPIQSKKRSGFLAPVLRWESCENDEHAQGEI